MKFGPKRLLLPLLALTLAMLACNLGSSSPDPDNQPTAAPTAAPTATTAPPPTQAVQLGAEYYNDALGFAFSQVPGWETIDEFSFFVHQPPGADPDKGPAILLFSDLYETEVGLDDVYNDFLSGFDTDDGSVVTGTSFDTSIDGFPARGVEISGVTNDGSPMLGQVYVILVDPLQSFILFGYTTDTVWVNEVQSYFEAVTDSLLFYEPVVEETIIEEVGADGTIRQWGVEAYASSEYTDTGWSAMQATGAPDVFPECGDVAQAWAPQDRGTADYIEIFYDVPVFPTEINIYETYNPGFIVAVDVLAADGGIYTVYNEFPEAIEFGCSAILELRPEIDIPVESVVIYVDTTTLGDWTEIDAVELVGFPASE